MNTIEKKPQPDFRRDNEYAGEVIRVFNLLKTKMSEEEATQLVYEIEKAAKENDEVVKQILSDPRVIEQYDVKAYNGLELHPKLPESLPLHFIRDGLWTIKSLEERSLLAYSFFNSDETYNKDKFFEWFNQNMNFNKLRLEELKATGNLMVTDPTKVRIKKIEESNQEESDDEEVSGKKEIIH